MNCMKIVFAMKKIITKTIMIVGVVDAVAVPVISKMRRPRMVRVKSSFTYPGGRSKSILTMWGDKVSANGTNVTLSLSRPKTRNKFITVWLNELRSYEYTVKVFAKIYSQYSLLSEKTIEHYAREIASKLLELGLIGGD
ncbi:hypothetical protein ACXM1Q_001820 [Streptococcus sp. 10F2]